MNASAPTLTSTPAPDPDGSWETVPAVYQNREWRELRRKNLESGLPSVLKPMQMGQWPPCSWIFPQGGPLR